VLADWEHVVEVEAVVGGVFLGRVVDWHPAQPAGCVLVSAFVEERAFVFFEGAACFPCSVGHPVFFRRVATCIILHTLLL
jgi:hypothetical protein